MIFKWLLSFRRRPRWEVVRSISGLMYKARWSRPDWRGRYRWFGHVTQHCAERHAERLNAQGRRPKDFWCFRQGSPR